MPVTAKLSREFYDKSGDKIVNEMVEWFNQVDATYRADLRELNELNFARFDAKLEQRLAELNTELRTEFNQGFREVGHEFARLDSRLERMEGALTASVERLEGALDTKAATADVEAVKSDLLRHLYGAIIAAWGTLLAAMITLFSLARG